MNSKVKMLLGIGGFAILIAGSLALYNSLAKQTQQPGGLLPSSSMSASSLSSSAAASSASPGESTEQMRVPDFTVFDAAGNEVKLSDMIGKPIVLNFWASWCPYCVQEMPAFQKAWEELGDEVVFMMINETDGQQETRAKADLFLEQNGFSFPVYYDTNLDATYAYEAFSLPTSYFIDKDGGPAAVHPGYLEEETLRQYIDLIHPQ